MRPPQRLRHFTFGGRVPTTVGILIALTFVASIAGTATSLGSLGALVPDAVLHGQLWRLVTWVFFERDPIGLLFACLLLYWFGRDLSWAWGTRRFLSVYLGLAALVGAATCALGLLWPTVRGLSYIGAWPLAEAMTIAWATLYPDRQILAFFVVPISGKNLIYLTVGGTILFAVFYGPLTFIPHFLAEGLMLLYMGAGRRLWLRLQLKWHDRSRRRHLRVVGEKPGQPGPWLN